MVKRAGRCSLERPAGSHGRIVLGNSLWIAYGAHAVPAVLSGDNGLAYVTQNAPIIDAHTSFFTYAYSASPAMAASMDNVGAKYPTAFVDADGDHLQGSKNYKLHIPEDVPVALFWWVTVYDPITGSGLDNGQPFPSINAMDKPAQNADGSMDIYFGPQSLGQGKNWLATLPDKGFFVVFRLYGPKQAFYDETWKLPDIEKLK